ncbi:peptidase family C54 protein (macronuclear) [Tetrahymena thermophila SB210]|uniref:Cysteine protease n=1 Tax=Tetrahymena thermophila (strain SB210) TaxID=312017 RepID=Q22S30_TETTS|nr:peptidase family C54 protein [Tetrahymena thermophila SB210]EAR87942.2 peptidase family C54 protein [Tetrahymena thermophila SB210]|eukprot:XP_001008187.2 peptidase family C54 protein [Tetrahymena thermophila SB210]
MEEDSRLEEQKREQTFMEKMHDLGTNFLFNVSSWSFKSSAPFKKEDTVYMQGRNMNENKETYEKNYKEVLENFYNIIWITYRKNFPALLNMIDKANLKNQKMSEYISDTGWGCMVRVGQMAFAEGLRRHLVENKKLVVKKKEDLRVIIEGFLDDDQKCIDFAPYSIQKISKIALSDFNLLPGEWYTPIRICYILGLLHNERKAIKGTEDLKVAVFSSSRPIVFQDFLERMCKVDPQRGKHAQICPNQCRIIKQDQKSKVDHDHHKDIKLEKQNSNSEILVVSEETPKLRLVCPIHHELQYSMIVYIVCLIGLDTPQPEYLELAKKMMDFKYSLGLIGGKPKKALYFVGRIEDEFIYLDPHYVQEFSNEKNFQSSSQLETYFCKKFQTYPSKNIDSSFSLMYYLKDLEQLEEFYQFMMGLKRDYNEHFFMMMEDTEPSFCLGDGKESSNLISDKNLNILADNQNKKRQKEQMQQANQNFEEVDDIDENGNNIKNSKYDHKNKKDKVEDDGDDEYEVI